MQRKGVGAFLMAGVEALAVTAGYPYVRLDAYRSNPFSQAFYGAIGYEVRKEIEVRSVELVLMEKQVLL